jgi:hypothetical protein
VETHYISKYSRQTALIAGGYLAGYTSKGFEEHGLYIGERRSFLRRWGTADEKNKKRMQPLRFLVVLKNVNFLTFKLQKIL